MAPRTFELWFTGDDDEVGRTVFGSEPASGLHNKQSRALARASAERYRRRVTTSRLTPT